MNKKIYGGGFGVATALAIALPVYAQSIPTPAQLDAGAAQRRSIEQRREIEQQSAPQEVITDPVRVEEPPTRPAAEPAPQLSFVLKGVQINDSAFLSREELTAIAKPYIGRTVGFGDLQELVAQINAAYRAREIGTAQAVLPPQQITDGIVRIELVEGRLGEFKLSGNEYTRDSFIRDRVAPEAGAVVDTKSLQKTLIRFNRTSEIQLKAALQPGAGYGLTDVLLSVDEPERNTLQFFLDNQGVESTGYYQLGMFARRNGLFGWDDQASVYLVGSDGTLTGSLSYGIPVNRSNGRLSVSYARNELDIVKGPFTALDITGESETAMLSFKQPLMVDELSQWDLALSVAQSRSETLISGVAFSESTVNKYSIGTSYERAETWGRWITSHTLSNASVDSDTEKWPSFFAYTGTANVLLPFKDCCTVAMNFGWQWLNEEQAPASELYQIGGLSSVRGYALGILSGARGYHAQFEAHRPLWWPGFSGFAFLDHGAVTPEPKESITGAGIGVSYRHGRRWSFDVSYGVPFNKVVPDQDSGRLDARLVLNFYP